jgi:hypothetical protein|nr:DUF4199 domain-containing protein [uncultured Capnocytophaga sp.]
MRNARSIMLFYGILSGIISIGLTLLQYFTNSYNGNPLSVILFGVIPIFLLVFSVFMGIYQSKNRSFRQMMKIGLGISILFAIITGIFWIFMIKYIYPELLDILNQIQLEAFSKNNPDISIQELENMKVSMEENKSAWVQFNSSVMRNILFGLIISLLGSSFFKIIQRK